MKRLIEKLGLNKPRRKGYHAVTTSRLYVLFGTVVVLFSVLVWRLAYMQLHNRRFYEQKLATASQTKITNSAVRGQIYDAKGQPLVENKTYQAVVFTRSNKIAAASIKSMAQEIAALVSVSEVKLSHRDKVDYYLADAATYTEVVANLSHEEKYDAAGNRLAEARVYANAVASVTEDQVIYSPDEEEAIELFSQMNSASNFETVTLVTDELSAVDITKLAAKKADLPGVDIKTAWHRQVLPTSLASIIGTVSTEQAGLPEEEAQYYLAQGYSLNDRVGTSYLEKQYESYLQGKREEKQINLDKNGNVESMETIAEGQKGKNLKLTIDLAFQDGVNKILQSHFQAGLDNGQTTYSEGIYAVALDPNTGAVLAMSGYSHEPGSKELKENALGTVANVFVPGSVVKAATITAGWENQLIAGNQTLTDQPIVFAGSAPITSWFTIFGNRDITAVQALQYSSNTYMVQLALKLMGQDYTPNMLVSPENLKEAMEKLRASFAEYGLGVATGIDLPLESIGYIPDTYTVGNYLTNAFGQFDNYTPMQLAQYAATVANGGNRIAPHIVEGIYDNDEQGGLGELISQIPPTPLNQVNITSEQMALLRQGFDQVVNSGDSFSTGRSISEGAAVSISAKTGTAETQVKNSQGETQETVNVNVVAYAPSHQPKIAVAVLLPHNTDLESKTAQYITREIINLYHQLHPMTN